MGKAKRKLIAARKAYYDYVYDDCDLEEQQPDFETKRIETEMYNTDTAFILQQRLIEYAMENNWPLCEFLDLENVENFIQWMLYET